MAVIYEVVKEPGGQLLLATDWGLEAKLAAAAFDDAWKMFGMAAKVNEVQIDYEF